LPGTAAHFAGREGELAVLAGLLERGGQERPGTVVISAIGGTVPQAGQILSALTRLFGHYLHTAATAMDTLFPGYPRTSDGGDTAAGPDH
jgi:hypothetical protein